MVIMKTVDDIPLNTWWKRKSNGKLYFLKDKGFGNVALVEVFKNEVNKILVDDFIKHANSKNFIQYNQDGTLQS